MEIKDYVVSEDEDILKLMAKLDNGAKKNIFVVRDKKLVAVVTDGDIRRWILKTGSLTGKVKDIANYKPCYVYEDNRFSAKEVMIDNSISALPIVNGENEIVSIHFWGEKDIYLNEKIDIPVVMMAGGLGTRLYPYTKVLPKPLIPIGEIPISERIIEKFNSQGVKKFFLLINHKKNMIKAYYNEIPKDYDLEYIDENEPLGTGGGLSLLKGKIDSTFILSNCDILIDSNYKEILNYHNEHNFLITMVCSLKNIKIPYGVVDVSDDGLIKKMQEKPTIEVLVNTGMYIVDRKIVDDLDDGLKIGFPEIIEKYKAAGEKIGVYPISEDSWMDMGQLDEMEEMVRRLEK